MARISTYPTDDNIVSQDKVIGTDANGLYTKNYTFQGIVDWFNANGSVAIGGQNNYFFQSERGITDRLQGTISFEDFGGVGTNFSDITTFKLAEQAVTAYTLEDYLPTMVGEKVMLSQTDNLNNFGIYKVVSIIRDVVDSTFYNVTFSYIEGHGVLVVNKFYGLAIYAGLDDGDKTFVYVQASAANPWNISHNLNKFPSVSMVLSTGQAGIADVTYIDENNLTITFSGDESGKAYIN
jgi:hypothetical protein